MAPRRAAPKAVGKRAAAAPAAAAATAATPLSQSLTSQPGSQETKSQVARRRGRGRPAGKRTYKGPLETGKHGKFAIYIARIVKDTNKTEKPGTTPLKLGRRSMAIVNAFAEDMVERLTSTSIEIANRTGKKTVGLSEATLATRWMLGDIGAGELEKLALKSGQSAVLKYGTSLGEAPKVPKRAAKQQ